MKNEKNEITLPLWVIAAGVGLLAILGIAGVFSIMEEPSLAPKSGNQNNMFSTSDPCFCDAPIPDGTSCADGYSAESRVISSCSGSEQCSESSCTYAVFCVKRDPGRTSQYRVGTEDLEGTCFDEWASE